MKESAFIPALNRFYNCIAYPLIIRVGHVLINVDFSDNIKHLWYRNVIFFDRLSIKSLQCLVMLKIWKWCMSINNDKTPFNEVWAFPFPVAPSFLSFIIDGLNQVLNRPLPPQPNYWLTNGHKSSTEYFIFSAAWIWSNIHRIQWLRFSGAPPSIFMK